MARYFFHARLGAQRIPDHEGVEIDNLNNVRHILAEVAREIDLRAEWEFEVADADGEIQLVISAAELMLREH